MTTYYINPSLADNTGAGTTPDTPKKTRVGLNIAPGDVVLYLRGTTCTEEFGPTAPGTAGARILFGAYANADGSDNPALPRPIINVTEPVSTYSRANKDYVDYQDLDIRGTLTVGNNVSMFYLGKTAKMRRVRVETNVGAVSAWNANDVLIEGCELNGVSHASTNNNNLITISSDNTSIDNIRVLNNTLSHKGGGGSNSHVVRVETNSTTYSVTRLVIEGNTALPPNGDEKNPNADTIGLRLARCPGVRVRFNRINGVLSGIYVNGAGAIITKGRIEQNEFNHCYHFGIHLPGATRSFRIMRNKCWYPGSNMGPSYYGRGIEISSSGGQGQNGGHVIAFNSCCYARNWGGPDDNASEGVGIGLDDGTDSCDVYANVCAFNEGNGIQHFGGTGTMTGNHRISGNYLESNCMAAFKGRRTGGTQLTGFNAHISFAAHKGQTSYVVNNYMAGSTLVGISENSTSENILIKANNIFDDVKYPICMPAGRGLSYNNLFRAVLQTVQRYSNTTQDANGVPTFPALSFTGESDFDFNPMLDAKKKPKIGSPCIGAGRRFGAFYDASGRAFKEVPSIGPYESFIEVIGV